MGYVKCGQWTAMNCAILNNYCDVLLPNNMAQKWNKVAPFYSIMNLVLYNNFDIYTFYLLIYF